ncbi:hypothetical protein ACJMK2_043049 [Sinanodonta woodiana]|uniref:Uncharacterized protein n=1 Tax=Sinanodonta woodiana TaxID=1069815 RepID=A0ABD3VVS1_SINWO
MEGANNPKQFPEGTGLMSEILKNCRKRKANIPDDASTSCRTGLIGKRMHLKPAAATVTMSSSGAHVAQQGEATLHRPLRQGGMTSLSDAGASRVTSAQTSNMATLDQELAMQCQLWTQNADVMSKMHARMTKLEEILANVADKTKMPSTSTAAYDRSADVDSDGDMDVAALIMPDHDIVSANVIDKDDDDLFADLESFVFEQQETGPNVEEKLAEVLNKGLRSQLTSDKLKSVQDKYPRPANCGNLKVPRINIEVWHAMSKQAKSVDILLQKLQNQLGHILVPTLRVLELFKNHRNNLRELPLDSVRDLVMDNFKMTSFLFNDFCFKRRDLIKPELTDMYQPICAASNPITDWLFGDNLNGQVTKLNESQKAGTQLLGKKQQEAARCQVASNFKSNVPFLGRSYTRTGHQRTRNYQGQQNYRWRQGFKKVQKHGTGFFKHRKDQ